ncbi:hypothetical protein N7539_004621 [Penicillium diatomitis]|uniref:Uncharacterized protein n=1 Tax=Penicillium diatomitis TaxID=2819901 RepID=A0A9X0BYD1_9EURO|nr:uncharacterized protein N7539_004621 [Penicillium diatomitis]KAJ5489731.1 hypothetical protein N7539_004621 [Penicillium diatomitis]
MPSSTTCTSMPETKLGRFDYTHTDQEYEDTNTDFSCSDDEVSSPPAAAPTYTYTYTDSEDEGPYSSDDLLYLIDYMSEDGANVCQSEFDDSLCSDGGESRGASPAPAPAGDVDYVHFGKRLEHDGEGWVWERPDGDFWYEG